MPRTAYDPFKDESLGRAPPKTRIRIDWQRGARLLAGGEPAEAVAAALGIAEDRLWRHFNKSLRFQFLFRQALERNRLTAQLAFEAAGRRAVVQRCGRVEEIDDDSWQWLARQTGLTPGSTEAGDDAKPGGSKQGREIRLAAALKDAGRAPPNQALHNRIRKERKAMDAQFAELKAWGREAGILPPAPEPEPAPQPEPQSAGAAEKKDRLSENKTQISGNKTQISEAKPPLSADTRCGDARQQEAQPARKIGPAPPATGVFQPHHYGSVIDLTDMDGNPLPGREHLLRG